MVSSLNLHSLAIPCGITSKGMDLESNYLAMVCTTCVNLASYRTSLSFIFPIENWKNTSTCQIRLLLGLTELIFVKIFIMVPDA